MWHWLTRIQLLRYDPEDRLPFSEVLVHPWIVKHRKPKARPTAEKAATTAT